MTTGRRKYYEESKLARFSIYIYIHVYILTKLADLADLVSNSQCRQFSVCVSVCALECTYFQRSSSVSQSLWEWWLWYHPPPTKYIYIADFFLFIATSAPVKRFSFSRMRDFSSL